MTEKEKKTIFVVDDDEMLRAFYARVLDMEGFSVICAETETTR